MIGAIVYQLTKNLTEEQIKAAGFEDYFVDHTTGIYPQSASGVPWTAAGMQSKGDAITDLHENMAAEQGLRKHYFMLYKPFNGTEIDFPVPFFLADFLQQMQNTPKDSFYQLLYNTVITGQKE